MMAEEPNVPLGMLLGAIAAAEPHPWRPGEHARATGVSRDALDEPLNKLRMAGLVRLTEWEAGKGQGYTVTPEGQRALQNPMVFNRSAPRPLPPPRAVERDRFDAVWSRLFIAAQVGVFALGLTQVLERRFPLNAFLANGDGAPVSIQLAVSGAHLRAGMWWTLLSYALVHGGLLHLGMNLYGHWVESPLTERMWGRLRFPFIYLTAVLGGAAGAVLAQRGVGAVGSSGALCGLLGAEAVWIFSRTATPRERAFWLRHFTNVGLVIALVSMVPGVSWGGHAGGAAAGAASALAMQLTRSRTLWVKLVGWLFVALVPAGIVASVYGRRWV